MSQQTKHTPTPWKTNTAVATYIQAADGCHIAKTDDGYETDLREANAAFIVRACNSHDALVNQSTRLLKAIVDMNFSDEAIEAIEDLTATISAVRS